MGDGPARGALCRRRVRQPERAHQRGSPGERDLTRGWLLAVALLLGAAGPTGGQELQFWVDAATQHATPPAGIVGEATLYGSSGAHLDLGLDRATGIFGGSYGRALSGTDAEWLYGNAHGGWGRRIGRVGVRLAAGGFGLRYLQPFEYDAFAVELLPTVSVPSGRFVVAVRPHLLRGGWTADSLEGDLGVTGAALDIERRAGKVTFTVSAGVWDVGNGVTSGTFLDGGATARLDRDGWSATAELRGQRTPLEDELGGRIGLDWGPAEWARVRLEVGRTLRDRVFGTPGNFAVSAAASIRAAHARREPPPRVVEVGEPVEGGRLVRFALRAPEAERVELLGDFNAWQPVPMEPSRHGWRLALPLEPGLHHFGFRVDGEWAVPPDAPGLVDDGWGRLNASVVVEP